MAPRACLERGTHLLMLVLLIYAAFMTTEVYSVMIPSSSDEPPSLIRIFMVPSTHPTTTDSQTSTSTTTPVHYGNVSSTITALQYGTDTTTTTDSTTSAPTSTSTTTPAQYDNVSSTTTALQDGTDSLFIQPAVPFVTSNTLLGSNFYTTNAPVSQQAALGGILTTTPPQTTTVLPNTISQSTTMTLQDGTDVPSIPPAVPFVTSNTLLGSNFYTTNAPVSQQATLGGILTTTTPQTTTVLPNTIPQSTAMTLQDGTDVPLIPPAVPFVKSNTLLGNNFYTTRAPVSQQTTLGGKLTTTPPQTTTVLPNTTSTSTQNSTSVSPDDIEETKSLLKSLFDQYDTRIRPLDDQSKCLTIRSSFVPQTVIELNTQTQVLSIQGYFKFHWKDEILQWDKQAYAVGAYIRVPTRPIWIPHIKISKDLYSGGAVGSRDTDIALVRSNGEVMWWPEGIYSIVCQVDITFYPYDTQKCSFTYYVDDEVASDVQLELLKYDVNIREYIENAEWKLTNATHALRLVDDIYYIDYYFTLERRSQFATFTLVVPAVAISLLCACSFLVPVESGEKGGVSMTVFLACCVYMTILVDLLPHNSLTHSNFLLYITILLFVSVFLILYTIIQAKLLHVFGDQKCVRLTFFKGQKRSLYLLVDILKWIDNILFVLSSICLVCSYFVLIFAMAE